SGTAILVKTEADAIDVPVQAAKAAFAATVATPSPPLMRPTRRAATWNVSRPMPVTETSKFGTITPELIAMSVRDSYYKDLRERIMAISDALNAELHALADAGCPVIQMEEPQIHLLAAKGLADKVLNQAFMVEVFNNTVRGLGAKTEIWCHTCWGNPSQQRVFAKAPSYEPALDDLDRVDADVVTLECCSSGGLDFKMVGERIKDKKIAIGVIDHHTLQVETPDQVAFYIREALK